MSVDPNTPVLIGGGQVSHHAAGLDDALSPIELIAEAVRRAATDAGLGAVPRPDALRVVELLSWRYRDPARFVAAALRVTPRVTGLSTGGGNTPQALVNRTAGEIRRGELELAVIAGAEAWRTRQRARRQIGRPPWTKIPETVVPDEVLGGPLEMNLPAEQEQGITLPIQLYPIFETALRAAAGETPAEHLVRISEMWARLSQVAATNPYAWSPVARAAEEIRTVSAANRMIGLPYPKAMNSNNDVDQGAAVLICSAAKARSLGVAEDRWIFVHSGSDCHEHFVSHRPDFLRTPAIERGGAAALTLAGVGIDDIDLIDLYSCFPSAVQYGARSLGLPTDGSRPLTLTGGLSFAGGPWNNYVTHALATMIGELRALGRGRALIWANGGHATKHSFGVYGTDPPAEPFRAADPQAEIDALPRRACAERGDSAGGARVEAYTVMHSRDGMPARAIAACVLGDDRRAWATSEDPDVAAAMCTGEWVGLPVAVDGDGGLHLV